MGISLKVPKPFISGSMLKLIAMTTMLIDHLGSQIFSQMSAGKEPFFSAFGRGLSLYYLCKIIGRLAFPLYCFLLTEGFIHTKNRKKYGLRLFVFALISELPWDFTHTSKPFYATQNVMFTLFFGYLSLCALEYFEKDKFKQLIALMLLFFVCSFSGIDYGVSGLLVILVIYLLRDRLIPQAILAGSMLWWGWAAIFAFVPINFYNGKRGFMKGNIGKYIGYLFYPVHLLLLGILNRILFG